LRKVTLRAERTIFFLRFGSNKNLAGFKKPKSVDFWKELPKSPQGKILKKEIRKHFEQ